MVASFMILSNDTDCIAIRRPFSIREVENGMMDALAYNCNKSSGLGAGPERERARGRGFSLQTKRVGFLENSMMDASAYNCNKSSGLGAGPEGFLHLPPSQNFEIQNQAATSPSVHSYANLSICEPNLHFHMVKNKEGLSLQKQ
jgi:hypothetical protein